MTVLTDAVPAIDVPPPDPVPSRVRPLIGGSPASRRTVLRGLTVSAMAAALVPLDWLLARRPARADGPISEWLSPDCRDAYSDGYSAMHSNWGSGPAVCYGGWRMGDYPCNDDRRHFEGMRSYNDGEEMLNSYRIDSACGEETTRNAWRWAHDGLTYRCSDAITTVTWRDGSYYTDLTISACGL